MRLQSSRSIAMRVALIAACLLASACATGPVKRVSEPTARIQQLTVQANGQWQIELRLENFSSIPMRFDSIDLGLALGGVDAGRLASSPALTIGPESADTVSTIVSPAVAGKLAAADALAAGRSVEYTLKGSLAATPDERKQRTFNLDRSSVLSPAPGLPGVLR